jgi:glycosyltransferase involved in cell wall biosynthesis
LVVGGKGRGEIAAVMAVAQRCGYADHVEVTGWTDKSTMDRYLRTARIGAVPLTDTFFNRYLTSPLKLFDFYRYGIPVLAADLPTLRELVVEPDTGFFYQPGSVDSLAAAIDAAFGLAPARYAAMVENAYAHAEELQWRNRAAALAAVFQSGGAAR